MNNLLCVSEGFFVNPNSNTTENNAMVLAEIWIDKESGLVVKSNIRIFKYDNSSVVDSFSLPAYNIDGMIEALHKAKDFIREKSILLSPPRR